MMGRWVRGAAVAVTGVASAGTAGCGVEVDSVEMRWHATATHQLRIEPDRDVDLLFVIDDSSDSALAQARLVATNIAQRLDAANCPLDYRIGFTTTDTGNPACDPATAENGRFVASSCLGRLSATSSTNGRSSELDANAITCANGCRFGPSELDARMRPTTTEFDETPRVRPWLERINGNTNLPDGMTMSDAVACIAPQGTQGCDFPSPLDALEQALVRTRTRGEPEYGFLRPGVPLLVVFVTTGHECSYQDPDIFAPDGTRVFWTDPNGEAPTEGVCWRAGVECTGAPDAYATCDAVDHEADGNASTDDTAAVLRPVGDYVDLLQAIEDEKKTLDSDVEIMVSVITGVPDGYPWGQGEIAYADSPEPAYQAAYGIGPGCAESGSDMSAVPPVRLRAFAEEFGDRGLYSACQPDYADALSPMFDRVDVGLFRPMCFRTCAEDIDPSTDGLQPECYVEQEIPGETKQLIERCVTRGGGWWYPSDDADVCWFPLTDASQTGLTMDDMSDECIGRGVNLEFHLLQREGTTTPGGTATYATCVASPHPEIDCPGLD